MISNNRKSDLSDTLPALRSFVIYFFFMEGFFYEIYASIDRYFDS